MIEVSHAGEGRFHEEPRVRAVAQVSLEVVSIFAMRRRSPFPSAGAQPFDVREKLVRDVELFRGDSADIECTGGCG